MGMEYKDQVKTVGGKKVAIFIHNSQSSTETASDAWLNRKISLMIEEGKKEPYYKTKLRILQN